MWNEEADLHHPHRMCHYCGHQPWIRTWSRLGFAEGLVRSLSLTLLPSSNLLTIPSNEEDSDPLCREKPELCIGGSLNAKYISKKGAFNGTGLALAGESWNKGQKRIFTLYFQHHTGDIRSMQYDANQQWLGGTRSETVAPDAKNATPISAVSFSIESSSKQYVSQTTHVTPHQLN